MTASNCADRMHHQTLADITRVGELDGWEYPIPPDRIHEKKDIQSMHPSARARFRLDADPIVAMHKLVGKEPEKTYL